MAEYIERDMALKALCQVSAPTPSESYIVEKCIDKINDVPAAEVAPVVHAYWVWKRPVDIKPVQNRLLCSNCGTECPSKGQYYIPGEARFCLHCGATMHGIGESKEDKQ